MALSFPVEPMKASLGNLPPASQDHEWAYEIKWDGHRTLAFVDAGKVRLQSSLGNDVTGRYPELAGLPSSLNTAGAILDGEVVAVDEHGRHSFGALQQRSAPVVFHVFDVLQVDGVDTIALPYEARRTLLNDLLEAGSHWLVPAHRVGDGALLAELTAAQGMEGVVAKHLGSAYVPGARSKQWIKVKHRRQVEVVVVGFTRGKGGRSNSLGALLVATPTPSGGLRFAGGVGSGFTEADLAHLGQELGSRVVDTCPCDAPPPRGALHGEPVWVRPDRRALVEIAEFTNDGFVRHASYLHLV